MLATAVPHGTVTFLFTDMEGSTRLWDEHPTAMNDVLARHDAILDEAVGTNGGYVFSRAGDGWGVAFSSAVRAVHAALDIQHAIDTEAWPDPIEGVHLRMGLHAGTANERDGDFFGTTVNRAARVSAAANGGQIYVTDAVRALIADDPGGAWRLHDLGDHRLRDLARLEHLWQLTDADAVVEPTVHGPQTIRGNLPKRGAAIVGRERDREAVVDALGQSRVVTLAGVGGVGKTTLAIEVARTMSGEIAGGAWFVDLSVVVDPEDVPATILSTIGAKERPDMTIVESLIDALAIQPRVIVLDNAEHLVDAVADLVDTLARRAPASLLIVTSREPLAIGVEAVHRLAPLDMDADGSRSPAATLFIDRALAIAPDLTDGDFDEEVVERICRHLDGLPLAIELAAAHAEVMTPSEILGGLESDRLSLASASRSSSQRHRSLEDLIAWSYDRLDADSQRVFERLSVFVGGCPRDAAIAVCGDEGIEDSAVLAALRTLVRKSMVTTERSEDVTRFDLLETLRTFAAHRLVDRDDIAATSDRHARWYAGFSEAAHAGASTPDEGTWLRRMMREVENLERAAEWACASRDFALLGELATCLPVLLESRIPPGIDGWIDLALGTLPATHPARIDYAEASAYRGMFRGDIEGAVPAFDEATKSVADDPRLGFVREAFRLIAAFFLGDLETVIRDSPAAIDESIETGDLRRAGSLGSDLGLALLFSGDRDGAWSVAEDLREPMEESGVPSVLGWYQYFLGELTAEHDPAAAIDHLEEAVEHAVDTENDFVAGISLIAMAATAGRNDRIDTALDAMDRAIRLWYGIGNRPQFWTAIRNLVEILHRIGRDDEAMVFHAAVEADAAHAPNLFGPYGDLYRDVVASVTDTLAGDAAALAAEGGALDYAATANRAVSLISGLTADI